MLAAVDCFLGRECLDLFGKLGRRPFAEPANALHEIGLTLREGRGKRVIDGSGLDAAAVPQTLAECSALELAVAGSDRQVRRRGQSRCAHMRKL